MKKLILLIALTNCFNLFGQNITIDDIQEYSEFIKTDSIIVDTIYTLLITSEDVPVKLSAKLSRTLNISSRIIKTDYVKEQSNFTFEGFYKWYNNNK